MTIFRLPRLFSAELWLRAGWTSVAFVTPAETAPALGLVFDDLDAAARIFIDWKRDLGAIDARELLRIAIVEGPVPGRPPGYSIHLGLDLDAVARSIFASGAGDLELTDDGDPDPWLRLGDPVSPALRRFKTALARHDHYLLVPGFVMRGEPELVPHLAIGKQRVVLRHSIDIITDGDPDAALFDRAYAHDPHRR